MSKTHWHRIRVSTISPNFSETIDNIKAIDNIALTLCKKKGINSPWSKHNIYGTYEVLIRNLTDKDVAIIESLGYDIKTYFISRKDRRELYKKLTKDEKQT